MKNINGLFFNNGFEGLIILLDEVLSIEQVNDNFESILGYRKEEVEGKAFTKFILPDEKSSFFDLIYNNKQIKTSTLRLYHSSGAYRYFTIDVYLFNDATLLFGKPIEKQYDSIKHNERAGELKGLEKREINANDIYDLINRDNEMLSYFFDVFPLDVWIKDTYGRYVFVNQSHQNSTGINKEDMLKKQDYEIFEKSIAKSFTETDYFAIESKKPLQYIFESKDNEFPQYTQVTKYPLYNSKKDYIGLLSFAVDVTEMKELQLKKERHLNHVDQALKHFKGLLIETDKTGKTYLINGTLVQHLPKNNLENSYVYEIFELLGASVESIEKLNQVIVHQKENVIDLNKGIKLKLTVFPFETLKNESHILIVGTVIENE